MIQRIQTVFLLLAAIASASTFLLPLATCATGNAEFPDGKWDFQDNPVVAVLLTALSIISFYAIMQFSKRQRQILLCLVGQFLGAACGVYIGFKSFTSGGELSISYGSFLPVLAVGFLALAARYIKKDEELVRSMDRLR